MCRIVYIEASYSGLQRLEPPLPIISFLSAHAFMSDTKTLQCEGVPRFTICYHNILFSSDSYESLEEQEGYKATSRIRDPQHHALTSSGLNGSPDEDLTATEFHFCFVNNNGSCRAGEMEDWV